jgi:hypothetical protein
MTQIIFGRRWGGGGQVCSNEGERSSPRGNKWQKSKNTLNFLKNILQKHLAKFNQTWYKLSLGKENSICSSKGPDPFQRGDNHKNVKMEWGYLKIFLSKSMKPEELIFT